jgi:DNA-3-methyladenine glycosylase I
MSNKTRSIARCPWPGIDDPEYARYHDEEWGVPKTDDRDLFEKIILESFQAGLSWLTILKKRENFRTAFHGFEPERIARYTDKDHARLMADAGIVRNRLKIDATINNARAYLKLRDKQTLSEFVWGHLENGPLINQFASFSQVPTETATSKEISKSLKKAGFRFVGPTTMYAFMQASGLVNDHLTTCPRHKVCTDLQKSVQLKH